MIIYLQTTYVLCIGTIRQERRTPPHAGGMHPALRERGRAIPSSHIMPKIIERSDYIMPKTRPPLGSAGRIVSAPQGSGTMGIIMPLYTIGIVLFFLYTIVKVICKCGTNLSKDLQCNKVIGAYTDEYSITRF